MRATTSPILLLGVEAPAVSPTVVGRPGSQSRAIASPPLPKGLWRKSTRNQLTGTALVPDSLTDFAGGACFNDARVEVALLERPVLSSKS